MHRGARFLFPCLFPPPALFHNPHGAALIRKTLFLRPPLV